MVYSKWSHLFFLLDWEYWRLCEAVSGTRVWCGMDFIDWICVAIPSVLAYCAMNADIYKITLPKEFSPKQSYGLSLCVEVNASLWLGWFFDLSDCHPISVSMIWKESDISWVFWVLVHTLAICALNGKSNFYLDSSRNSACFNTCFTIISIQLPFPMKRTTED